MSLKTLYPPELDLKTSSNKADSKTYLCMSLWNLFRKPHYNPAVNKCNQTNCSISIISEAVSRRYWQNVRIYWWHHKNTQSETELELHNFTKCMLQPVDSCFLCCSPFGKKAYDRRVKYSYDCTSDTQQLPVLLLCSMDLYIPAMLLWKEGVKTSVRFPSQKT